MQIKRSDPQRRINSLYQLDYLGRQSPFLSPVNFSPQPIEPQESKNMCEACRKSILNELSTTKGQLDQLLSEYRSLNHENNILKLRLTKPQTNRYSNEVTALGSTLENQPSKLICSTNNLQNIEKDRHKNREISKNGNMRRQPSFEQLRYLLHLKPFSARNINSDQKFHKDQIKQSHTQGQTINKEKKYVLTQKLSQSQIFVTPTLSHKRI